MLKQAATFAQDLLPPTFHFGIKSSQLDLLSFYLKGNFLSFNTAGIGTVFFQQILRYNCTKLLEAKKNEDFQ